MKLSHVVAGCVVAAGSFASAQEVLYALNDYISPSLMKIDPATGNVLQWLTVTGHQSLFGGLAVDKEGTLYSIDGYNDEFSDRFFKIDPATGAGSVVGDTGYNWNFRCVSFDPTTRTMYGATDNSLFTIDPSTGAATQVAPITGDTLDQMTAMAIDAKGNAYLTDIGGTGLFALDLSNGKAKHLGDIGQDGNWYDDLAFDAAGTLWGSRVQGGLFTIDIKAVSQTFKYSGIYRGLAFYTAGQECYADCDGDGELSLFDFLCYTNLFNAGDDAANCDHQGGLDLFDFLCYTNAFNAGC